MSLEKERINLMNAIYQMDINKFEDVDSLDAYFETLDISDKNKEKLTLRVKFFVDNIDLIDGNINKVIKKVRLDRLTYIDRALLRIAMFEITIEKDIAYQIVINDIVELAKKYSDENSYKFINAILGDYVRNYYND